MTSVPEFCENDISNLKSFILDAWRLAGPSGLGWTGATDENIGEIASDSFLKGLFEDPHVRLFICKKEQQMVGFCAIRRINAKSVELTGIIVRQNHLGKGIGSELFKFAKKVAVESGFATMLVKTESNNLKALHFYSQMGFVVKERVFEVMNDEKVSLTILRLKL